jgi:aminoglycoside phosphotransferase (APT) family kinase protein
MSTIGHPLSDISNLLTPYFTARLDPRRSVNVHPGFLPRATRGLPAPDEITALYFSVVAAPSRTAPSPSSLELTLSTDRAEASPRDKRRELQWAQAFNIFRLAAICQGIAARQAGRQASSEQARRYGDARGPLAEFAWELVQSARSTGGGGGGGGSGGGGSGGNRDNGRGSGRGPRL